MKKLFIILSVFLSGTSLNAQIILSDIEDINYPEAGVYYKDVNHILDPFVGTWLYTNGNTSFKIVLEKMEHSSASNGIFFEDLLIGAYRYVENGVEKVNTLNDLQINYSDGRKYPINSGAIMTGKTLGQTDVLPNEKWIYGSIKDPVSGSIDRIFIKGTTVNGQEAIKISIYHHIQVRHVNDPIPPPISYPLSTELVLIKQ
ncbi:MAG TPA: DUF6705 family protein [Flavobacteriaceae bacterium]|nr:DUF6705 family protein [Flavobacteriaceae bacterium]